MIHRLHIKTLSVLCISMMIHLAAAAATPQSVEAGDKLEVQDTQPTTYVILDFPWPEENAPRDEVVIVEMPPIGTDMSQATTYTILDITWPEDEVLPDPDGELSLEWVDEDVYLDGIWIGCAETVDVAEDDEGETIRCSQVFADEDDIGPIQCIHAFAEVSKVKPVQCVSVFADAPEALPGLTCLDIFLDY